MNVVIIEDEYHAAQRLEQLMLRQFPEIVVIARIESVEEAVKWFSSNNHPPLIFMDIQLADGLSFSIFDEVEISSYVIFTTAFDQYALQAFKHNSIDYLLKPIDEDELNCAINKFLKFSSIESHLVTRSIVDAIKTKTVDPNYRERLLLKNKDRFNVVFTEDVAYFYSEQSVTFLVPKAGKTSIYDSTLNDLDTELNPKYFFRINRSFIIRIDSILELKTHFNNRIKLVLKPAAKTEILVSRDRVKAFKTWLGG